MNTLQTSDTKKAQVIDAILSSNISNDKKSKLLHAYELHLSIKTDEKIVRINIHNQVAVKKTDKIVDRIIAKKEILSSLPDYVSILFTSITGEKLTSQTI